VGTLGDWFRTLEEATRGRLLSTVALLTVLLLLRWLTLLIVARQLEDPLERFRWKKGTLYVTVAVGTLLVGPIWITGIQQLAAYFGIASAGIAIALKDPLANLAGWAFIIWRQPFRLGDRLQIGSHRGDVVDVRLFQFTLLEIGAWVDADQHTGRVVHVPNHLVFAEPQVNYGSGTHALWNEIPVMVTFESDWQKAKALLESLVGTHTVDPAGAGHLLHHSNRYASTRVVARPGVVTRVADSGVLLTMRYICTINDRRGSEERIWEDVLHAFGSQPGIDFAYPTVRYYNNPTEGKQAGV
jgi:small-conductance mechanosensitive channel